MRVNRNDNRGRWIIIGGTLGATVGAGGHHLPIGIALGVAFGMTVGHLMNRLTLHRRH
ncbi:MAG TPA: hypothetical protein VIC03_04965 [Gemmatimonadaceae bacterium]|jgi:hypothetical protein